MKPVWIGMSGLVLLSGLLQLQVDQLCYVRDLLWHEPWRWWTAHWVHVGWVHYALNMLALLALPFIFPRINLATVLVLLLVLSGLLSTGLYIFLPHLAAYAGLSGVLHGLYGFVAGAALGQAGRERQFAALVLLCMLIKVMVEKWLGFSHTAALIQAPVLIEAHQIGLLLGLVLALAHGLRPVILTRFC